MTTAERNENVALLLSVFNRADQDMIVTVIRQGGYNPPNRTASPADQYPPAVLGFLSNPLISVEDKRNLMWGFSTLVYATLKKPKDSYFYKTLLKDAFLLSDTFAEQIAKKVETDDHIEGWFNRILDWSRRWLLNTVLPESFEVSQPDRYDLDGAYEMLLLGREIRGLMTRSILSGITLSNYIAAGEGFGPLSETFNVKATDIMGGTEIKPGGDPYGDPDNMSDNYAAKLVSLITDVAGDAIYGDPDLPMSGEIRQRKLRILRALPPVRVAAALAKTANAINRSRTMAAPSMSVNRDDSPTIRRRPSAQMEDSSQGMPSVNAEDSDYQEDTEGSDY